MTGGATAIELVTGLWNEILGETADPDRAFLENGGDSFSAVLLSTRIFEATGAEVDYLDVLDAADARALAGLVTARVPADS